MSVDTFDHNAEYEFFSTREHDLCPHCGQRGNKTDEGGIVWGSHRTSETEYTCTACKGEWTIRRYYGDPFSPYPQPPYACIYIPGGTK